MKLFLMRHAEAQETRQIDDIFRELTNKGIEEAREAKKFLQNYQIDKILVSSAKRTMQTAEIIQKKLISTNFEVLSELYTSSASKIIEIISKQDDNDKTILLIAHNPGIFDAALNLTNPDSSKYDLLIENGMPTAKIIDLDFLELKNWSKILKKKRNYCN